MIFKYTFYLDALLSISDRDRMKHHSESFYQMKHMNVVLPRLLSRRIITYEKLEQLNRRQEQEAPSTARKSDSHCILGKQKVYCKYIYLLLC